MRLERREETHGRKRSTREYSIALALLDVASVALLVFGVGGALYGFFRGIPVSDLNYYIMPTVLVGLALGVAVSALKRRSSA